MKQEIPRSYEGKTAVVVATGPSINEEQINRLYDAKLSKRINVITVNNAYQEAPFTDIQVACNDNWWEHYLLHDPKLRNLKADLWTRYKNISDKYGINYIDSIVKEGLSKDPSVVHINHGSGPMAINFATLYGFKKIILIGHDMKYAKDYDGKNKIVGSTPRHYFGEYPKSMQHFPKSNNSVDQEGRIVGLIRTYERMNKDLISMGVDVVNCTPNSALKCFRESNLMSEL
mgnify:CR=1 FL=1|tara:strand:- start:6035 stop:6724 length:690 start_codon:yes stop_codon:yes gene_type:complete